MRYLALLVIGAMACGGAKAPETTPNPARGLRNLTTDETELTRIVTAASRELPRGGASGLPTFFSGVFVGGSKARLAGDAVLRVTGYSPSSSTRTPAPQCAVQNMSTGQRTPIPCPASAKQSVPITYTMAEVRATADSAYVGVIEATDISMKASCVVLIHRETSWSYLRTDPVADAKQCGK